MNRRNFFSRVALAVGAVITGAALVPKAKGQWVLNPEWKATEYLGEVEWLRVPFPRRFVFKDGVPVEVNSHIYVKEWRTLIPNPDYINAPLEEKYLIHPTTFQRI